MAEQHQLDQLILVAGWDYNDLTPGHQSFWDKPIDHQTIKDHTNRRVVIHSNDPYTTPFQAEQMAKRLKAQYLYIENAGHFTQDDDITQFPAMLKYL